MRKQQSPGLRHVSVLNLPTQEQDNLICSRCVFPLGHFIIGLLVTYSSVAITVHTFVVILHLFVVMWLRNLFIKLLIRLWYKKTLIFSISLLFPPTSGYVYRNCTADGWSGMYPPYEEACLVSDVSESESEVATHAHAVVIMPISWTYSYCPCFLCTLPSSLPPFSV